MKFAFCVEDETDQEVFRGLLSRVLGQAVEADDITYRFPPGGWATALKLAPSVARRAYHAGLDGALFAIDNDHAAPLHDDSHTATVDGCRHCLLREKAKLDEPLSWPRPELPPLRYVVTVPVRTIETWLLLGSGQPVPGDPHETGRDPAGRKALKKAAYGMEQPDARTMRETAERLLPMLDLDRLARESPSFRAFLAQLR